MEAQKEGQKSRRLEELGYVLLEDCQIEIPYFEHAPSQKWLEVEQLRGDRSTSVPSTVITEFFDGTICRRCKLVLQQQKDTLQIDWGKIQHYDGTVKDVKCSCDHANKRSDAALLLGLIAACRRGGEVQVCNCKVLFRDDEHKRASLLVTLAFPHLEQNKVSILHQPSSLSTRRSRIVSKPLYPALQLLLSIIRSDWKHLEATCQQLLRGKPRTTKHSFFPSKLTLGEIYQRIQGSSDMTKRSINTQKEQQQQQARKTSMLLALPEELLAERMAPFWRAPELASVRCTCTYLHDKLRGVVPGLKLRLYKHQITSLSWMRTRESCVIRTENDCFRPHSSTSSRLSEDDDDDGDDDIHRAVTGGATVRLSAKGCNWTIRIDPGSGRVVHPEATNNVPRQVARGGLLCDSPGLGKTITVLALILQTCGLSTAKQQQPSVTIDNGAASAAPSAPATRRSNDDEIFQAYWQEVFIPEFRWQALQRLVHELCKRNTGGGFLPVVGLQKAIAKDEYGDDFSAFEKDVKKAIRQYAPDDESQSNASLLLDSFNTLLREFKETQLLSAKKSFSNANSKPNSRVASLIEEDARQRLLDSLVPSSGTLLVIPSVLMEHWQTQIERHVNLQYCTDRIPLVFEYEKKDTGMTVDKATILCKLHKTHAPVVFLDKAGTRPLPPADFLAMFQIVITTTHRIMNEWKKGSFQEQLERNDSDATPSFRYAFFDKPSESEEACELLKVHFVRLVVDEGHSMGNDKSNSSIQFASWINAQRRWAMTGTPTKQNSGQMIGQLKGLMRFLQHEFFTSRLEGDVHWKRNIARCWRDGHLVSFFRLHSLLEFLMKRHTKLDIAELPPPVFKKTSVSMSFLEATTYNTVVCAVQLNILLTSMNGKTSGFQDSLLHRSQAKNARLVFQNIRRVCTGWSRVLPTLSDRWYRETLYMAEKFKLPEQAIADIRDFLHRAETEQLSDCAFCGMRLSTLVLMSCCGGLICTECMDNSTTTCYLCEKGFDVDELQKFQPGFVLDWKSNLESKLKKSTTQLSEVPSSGPVNPLIEVGDAEHASEADDAPLIRPPQNRRRKRKFGDGHACTYDRYAADGKCLLCKEEHNFCNLLNEKSRCNVCHRIAEECPDDESKSFYLVGRLLELYKSQSSFAFSKVSERPLPGEGCRPLKVIVFSQFRNALDIVGDRLLKRFGTACIAEYFGRYRKQELHKFTYEGDCFCLLLTKDGAEGLDLSFVTNIIFLEEIYDKSLQDQAVARAWRMGARGACEVETLVARCTVEETMGEQRSSEQDDDSQRSSSADQQRLKSLLLSLRFITDYHGIARPSESKNDEENTKEAGRCSGKRKLLPGTMSEQKAITTRMKKVKFDVDTREGS